MARKTTERAGKAERVLRQLCQALSALHAAAGREWISFDDLRGSLRDLTFEQAELAVAVAIDRGWLNGAGRPPHHVQLTGSGREVCRTQSKRKRRRQSGNRVQSSH